MGRRDGPRPDGLPAMAVERLVRAVDVRPELAEAALANEAIRGLIASYPEIYIEAGLRRSPIVRAEFEHATVIGHPGEEVIEYEDDRQVPAAEEGWSDLADAYLLACQALSSEPVIRDADAENDQDSGG